MNEEEKRYAFYADLILYTFNIHIGNKFKNYIGALGYPGQIATIYKEDVFSLVVQESMILRTTVCESKDFYEYICKAAKWISGTEYSFEEIIRISNIKV